MNNVGNGGDTPAPPEQRPLNIPPEPPRSQRATTALVLGILGFVCCQLIAPVAWYLGNQELREIRAGRVSPRDEGTAKAGMILGIIGTVFLVLAMFWILFFGGLAFLGALSETFGQ